MYMITAEQAKGIAYDAQVNNTNPEVGAAVAMLSFEIESWANTGGFELEGTLNVELNDLQCVFIQNYLYNKGYSSSLKCEDGKTKYKVSWKDN